MFKLNNTYKKVKDIFVKPKLRFYFGPWRKEPNLPVSHRGPLIRLFPKHHTLYKWDKDFKEKHPIFTKYFKPCYELPIWLTFNIFNRDICWKTKWGDYRFEYPGQFTIVFFGLSFSVWNTCPVENSDDEDYWEAILHYINSKKETPIEKLKDVDAKLGRWVVLDKNCKEIYARRLNKEFLKEPYKNFDN